jgi:hypothetical protein
MEVTQVVSLGGRCATSYHLRRFYNHSEGGLFDWWITSGHALLRVLDNLTPEFIYNPGELVRINGDDTVLHTATGLHLHHEFPRVGSGHGPVADSYLEHVEKPKNRTAYLMQKFTELNSSSERVLFVREGEVDEAALRERLAGLFSKAEWHLAVLPNRIRQLPGDQWYGNVELWRADLAALGFSLNNPTLKPFREPTAEDTPQTVLHTA